MNCCVNRTVSSHHVSCSNIDSQAVLPSRVTDWHGISAGVRGELKTTNQSTAA